MDFKSRFKGKLTIMNKDGVIGIVNKPSLPITKDKQLYTEISDYSPKQNITESNIDYIKESPSRIFTNIQITQNKKIITNYSQKLKNNGTQYISSSNNNLQDNQKINHLPPLKLRPDFNQLNTDEYEIIAIPRNMLGQLRQQLSVDRYALTHSFVPDKSSILKYKQYSPEVTLPNQKSITDFHFAKPKFLKQSSDKLERKNKTMQQAGLDSIQYNQPIKQQQQKQ